MMRFASTEKYASFIPVDSFDDKSSYNYPIV